MGTPINRLPIMAKQVLDLYELYKLVVERGGLVDVINKKLWQEIIKGLKLPSSITSAAFTLRTHYSSRRPPTSPLMAQKEGAPGGGRQEGPESRSRCTYPRIYFVPLIRCILYFIHILFGDDRVIVLVSRAAAVSLQPAWKATAPRWTRGAAAGVWLIAVVTKQRAEAVLGEAGSPGVHFLTLKRPTETRLGRDGHEMRPVFVVITETGREGWRRATGVERCLAPSPPIPRPPPARSPLCRSSPRFIMVRRSFGLGLPGRHSSGSKGYSVDRRGRPPHAARSCLPRRHSSPAACTQTCVVGCARPRREVRLGPRARKRWDAAGVSQPEPRPHTPRPALARYRPAATT
ncbi:hypothetical protein O3P69_013393 [Scylla paramamosain]|uniref:ARID domain-containing protein n=1 Tax=Scylla paramamosain TaxID=85552 RepID=A0AAW0U3C2_SCYPA